MHILTHELVPVLPEPDHEASFCAEVCDHPQCARMLRQMTDLWVAASAPIQDRTPNAFGILPPF